MIQLKTNHDAKRLMTAIEPFCELAGINSSQFSIEENFMIEAIFFERIRREIKKFFINQHKENWWIAKATLRKDNEMLETSIIRWVVEDVLATEQYDLKGIACYTGIPEDDIHELYIGRIMNPSVLLFRRIIELHKSVRPTLYQEIIKKLSSITAA